MLRKTGDRNGRDYADAVAGKNGAVLFAGCVAGVEGESEDVETECGAEVAGMSSADLLAVVGAWQSGAISRDTMFELFRSGEILPDGRTNEDEAALIGAGPKPLINANTR
jgi:hypothetical protein